LVSLHSHSELLLLLLLQLYPFCNLNPKIAWVGTKHQSQITFDPSWVDSIGVETLSSKLNSLSGVSRAHEYSSTTFILSTWNAMWACSHKRLKIHNAQNRWAMIWRASKIGNAFKSRKTPRIWSPSGPSKFRILL
jgi:hypothetical protein